MSDEDATSSLPLKLLFATILSRLMGIQEFHLLVILISRGCAPFGQHQESQLLGRSNFWTMCRELVLYSQQIRFSDLILNMHRVMGSPWIVVWDLSRGHDSWCWPKETQSLGMRMLLVGKSSTILQWPEMFLPALYGIKSAVIVI